MEIIEIDIERIKPNPNQPRKNFDKEKIQELANSIKFNGLINPISVQDKGDYYELISGERRLKAHKLAGIKTIKAIVTKEIKEVNNLSHALVENLQRQDLTSYEKAVCINIMINKGHTIKEISNMIGLSINYIENLLDLVKEENSLLAKKVIDKEISFRAFTDINKTRDENLKIKLAEKIVKEKIAPQKIREYVKTINKNDKEISNALLKNQIDLSQSQIISKIKNEKIKHKVLKAHKEIKNIDRGIEKSLKKVDVSASDNRPKLIKIKEQLETIRKDITDMQKINQRTMNNLIKTLCLTDLMDEKQFKKFDYYKELYTTNLENTLKLFEKIQEKRR